MSLNISQLEDYWKRNGTQNFAPKVNKMIESNKAIIKDYNENIWLKLPEAWKQIIMNTRFQINNILWNKSPIKKSA